MTKCGICQEDVKFHTGDEAKEHLERLSSIYIIIQNIKGNKN